jgi:hypothetical protein
MVTERTLVVVCWRGHRNGGPKEKAKGTRTFLGVAEMVCLIVTMAPVYTYVRAYQTVQSQMRLDQALVFTNNHFLSALLPFFSARELSKREGDGDTVSVRPACPGLFSCL